MGNAIRPYATGYVENMRDRLEYIVDFMYDNYEALNESRSCDLLCDLFSAEGFEISRHIGGVKNSFKATFGSEGTTIAYICDYDSHPCTSNICSHNFTAAMNAGAALGLKRAISEIGGRVVVFGCPNGAKINMLSNGEFDDVDAVICGHAATKTYESGTSLGCTYIDFTYRNKKSPSKIEAQSNVTPQNPAVQLFNLVETFKANYPGKVLINGTIENKIGCDDIVPGETKCSFSIKAFDKAFIDFAKNKLVETAKFCARFYDCSLRYNNSHKSYLPLKTHNELSKIASHNLKERGIINIHGPVTLSEGFELGNISARIPTINPGIGICKKESTFTVSEFNKTAKSPHAKENMLKAACALALTGVDAIQNPELLGKL